MKKLIGFLAVLFLTTYIASSQAFPEKAASIGFQLTQGEYGYGPVLNYAVNTDMHIGTQLGLYYDTGYQNKGGFDVIKSNFFFYLAPYVKYYFQNIKNFRPFVQGQLAIYTIQDYINGTAHSSSTGNYSGSSLWINVGGTWFPFNNLGVNAGIRFVDYNFDYSWMKIGLGNPFIGIDWYL